jgi:glucose/mannose-6-phosphate isomerase
MRVEETYLSWPEMAKDGFGRRPRLRAGRNRKFLLLGMGGSASAGDILAGWLYTTHGIESEVCKGVIPAKDLQGCFAIACSASGNTEETLAMMKTALERGANLVSISHGGKLEEVSTSLGVPHAQMPSIVAPRYMLPFMTFVGLRALDEAFGLDSKGEALEAIEEMGKARGTLGAAVPLRANPAKRLALRLLGRTPAVYGTRVTRGPGLRFKNVVSENSKRHAVYDEVPELLHNEIQAWEEPGGRFVPVLLRDVAEGKRDGLLFEKLHGVLTSTKSEPVTVRGVGKGLFSRLMTMAYELDFVSYYLAVGSGRDPFPTPLINGLKRRKH